MAFLLEETRDFEFDLVCCLKLKASGVSSFSLSFLMLERRSGEAPGSALWGLKEYIFILFVLN
jgi:hypothetical protein